MPLKPLLCSGGFMKSILDLGRHGELPGPILDLGRHGELPGHAIMESGLTGGTEHLLGDED